MEKVKFDYFKGKDVVITGGLGFVGSNLAIALTRVGANVTLVDSMMPDYGGNEQNILEIKKNVDVSYTDIRDPYALPYILKGKHFIFNLAGQISHMDSMKDPVSDLEINAKAQLNLLEACRKSNQEAVIIYASTRQIYGKTSAEARTNETHPLDPTDINGINKLSGELFHSLYHRVYGLKTISLRLTNTFGPRQLVKHNRQGFIAWFLNRTLLNDKISLYGDGEQIRDFTYVDDVVEAMKLAALNEKAYGQIYNLGGFRGYTLKEVAFILREINPKVSVDFIPFPDERKKIDIGSYIADWSKIEKELGWKPRVDLSEGLRLTVDYYRDKLDQYL